MEEGERGGEDEEEEEGGREYGMVCLGLANPANETFHRKGKLAGEEGHHWMAVN